MSNRRHQLLWSAVLGAGLLGLLFPQVGSVGVESPSLQPAVLTEGQQITFDASQAPGAVPGLSGSTGDAGAEAVCSPPPECWTDRDCNSVCGKKVGGECIVINSCYRICSCHST